MAPQTKSHEQVCFECRLCSFYWGQSCPGLRSFTEKGCIEIDK